MQSSTIDRIDVFESDRAFGINDENRRNREDVMVISGCFIYIDFVLRQFFEHWFIHPVSNADARIDTARQTR